MLLQPLQPAPPAEPPPAELLPPPVKSWEDVVLRLGRLCYISFSMQQKRKFML
jgi:hypothetical protein